LRRACGIGEDVENKKNCSSFCFEQSEDKKKKEKKEENNQFHKEKVQRLLRGMFIYIER